MPLPVEGEATAPDERSVDASSSSEKVKIWGARALKVWTLIGAAFLVYAFGLLLKVMELPVGIAIWTGIIFFCLRGFVNGLSNRGMSRFWAVVCGYALFAVVIAAVVVLMSSPFFGIGDQFVSLVQDIPAYANDLGAAYQSFMAEHQDLLANPTVSDIINDATNAAADWANGLVSSSVTAMASIGSAVSGTLFCLGFALVVAFWLLLISPDMVREMHRLVGNKHREGLSFLHFTFTRVVGGYIKGTALQCGIIALGCAIAFAILGIPNAIAFAIITGLLNIIPVIGPWLGGIAAAGAALPYSLPVAAIALVVTITIQQVVYTFISPKIMSESVDVHPMLVIFAMTIGLAAGTQMNGMVGGLTGMLLGIPVAAMSKSMFVYFFEKRTGRSIVSEDGVFFKGTPAGEGSVDPRRDAVSPVRLSTRLKSGMKRAAHKAGESAHHAIEAADEAAHHAVDSVEESVDRLSGRDDSKR
ncbi:AI-2E family transporter [Denitrobacterium detoxificans]|uniref:Predicted PurR-regulated permease PerM n=1 Tax=Denitrobacterium detoxificans TaxID=79604 RepID=A0A1H8TT85_9ACTN|nr:AI-2E family transporter [Denitrobacterium detoxificans]SEO94056.1 Predicted PurR-regulated permease PerM [Denitrobacterium detoxificans]